MAGNWHHMTATRSWRSDSGLSNPVVVRQLDAVRVNPTLCAQITRKAKADMDQPSCLRQGNP